MASVMDGTLLTTIILGTIGATITISLLDCF
jgi:hypothetical protein